MARQSASPTASDADARPGRRPGRQKTASESAQTADPASASQTSAQTVAVFAQPPAGPQPRQISRATRLGGHAPGTGVPAHVARHSSSVAKRLPFPRSRRRCAARTRRRRTRRPGRRPRTGRRSNGRLQTPPAPSTPRVRRSRRGLVAAPIGADEIAVAFAGRAGAATARRLAAGAAQRRRGAAHVGADVRRDIRPGVGLRRQAAAATRHADQGECQKPEDRANVSAAHRGSVRHVTRCQQMPCHDRDATAGLRCSNRPGKNHPNTRMSRRRRRSRRQRRQRRRRTGERTPFRSGRSRRRTSRRGRSPARRGRPGSRTGRAGPRTRQGMPPACRTGCRVPSQPP